MIFNREPVAIAGAIRAVILCAIGFGLKWTPEQFAGVMLAVEAVLSLVTRQKVTPVDDGSPPDGGYTDAVGLLVVLVIVIILLRVLGII